MPAHAEKRIVYFWATFQAYPQLTNGLERLYFDKKQLNVYFRNHKTFSSPASETLSYRRLSVRKLTWGASTGSLRPSARCWGWWSTGSWDPKTSRLRPVAWRPRGPRWPSWPRLRATWTSRDGPGTRGRLRPCRRQHCCLKYDKVMIVMRRPQ